MKPLPTKSNLRAILARKLRWYMDHYAHVDRQEKIAKRAGISQSSVNRVLSAKVDTQMRVVESLAQAIGVSPTELLTDDDNDAAVIHYDRVRFARLPDADKKAIERYIEFVLSQSDVVTLEDDGSTTIEEVIAATPASRRRAQAAARRPLSDELVSDEDEQPRHTRRRETKTSS
ncbi:helix-turn-helix transcriptional regulator [Burkholderia sp. Nafp2/4-1b]|uniref:helix-turn-helix domain-containing protein n=1 Tax=Burkholderia sp. Nafp2/4-1b TaxID=2116686 RepID=UPI001F096372|nr:helix-turn-helix transcriptional regulator [Burkholderia sp. Nafp2/4-1b]